MSETAARRSDIFRYRPYVLYFTAYSGSSIGNGMQFIANSWLALELTNSGASVALVLIASILPGLLLSPLIGIYVDRLDRRWLTVTADLFRGLVLLSVPLLWWLGWLQPWHLYLMTFLVALGTELYMPSAMGLIREVVPPEMLLYANSTNAIALQIGMAAGAGIGGLVIAISAPVVVMIINALTFVFSAACLWSMRKGRVLPTVSVGKVQGFRRFAGDMREGLLYIRDHPSVITKYIILLVIWATLRTINVLLAPFAKDVLQVGVQGFGYIDAAFAGGAILGNIVLPPVIQRYGANLIMGVGLWAISLFLLAFGFSVDLWMALATYGLLGLVFQVAILYITKAQESVPISHQGRVHSTFNTLFSLASLVVYMVMGVLGERLPLRWLYVFQALLVAATGLLAYQKIYRAERGGTHAAASADYRREEEAAPEGEGAWAGDAVRPEENAA